MDADEWAPLPKPKARGGWRALARRRLPVLGWARRYDRESAVADVVAGVSLGLTLVPQSIAYASLANLPVQYGLYSAFVGTFLYIILGTVKQVSIGPTSLMALLTLHTCRDLPIEYVVLLTFLSGVIVFTMGLLRLSFLVDLISPTVTSGFTSATAVIIIVSQLKGLLGLRFIAESPAENVYYIVQEWRHIRLPDSLMALVCCTTLLLLRKLKDIPVNPKRYALKKFLWLVSIARNALVVCAASAVAYYTYDPQNLLFKLSGRVEPGLPGLALPPLSAVVGNRTVSFAEMVEQLGFSLVLMPIVMVLANIAIAKAFSSSGRVDATQEMLTLGLCNVVGSLFRAMPTCGAFTRSAVSDSSGVRTPAAGLYSGLISLMALKYLTEYFFFIPKACLSSVLVCAVMFMVDWRLPWRLWRARRRELGALGITFAVGLAASVEAAVLCGVLADLAAVLRDLLRQPRLLRLNDKWQGRRVVLVQPRRVLVFVNSEQLAARIRLIAPAAPAEADPAAAPPIVLLDCSALALIDHTAIQVLERLTEEFSVGSRRLIVFNASGEVARTLRAIHGLSEGALREVDPRRALQLNQRENDKSERSSLDSRRIIIEHVSPKLRNDATESTSIAESSALLHATPEPPV
ncbi:sodium-independent sulfate anion transporter-like [Aricia agestis]|uniref:sodium-independent sulfate anion transporter-like n=1 Tax=Aricia agestis TaxID=91739 RepID=UPI001C203F2A|nr:sodium-independent sulfate anion transporter-like [Aricia agestis]